MKTIDTSVTFLLSVLAVLFFCTACTGINEKQVALDPVIATANGIRQLVMLRKQEFLQLKDAYAKTKQPSHLARMGEIMELVRDELERAEYLQKNNRYYRAGLDHERWRSAERTYAFCRKSLCEMMVVTGELHMTDGDKEYAAALFRAVVDGFEPGDDIASYIEQANAFMQGANGADLYVKAHATNDRHANDPLHATN